MEWGLDWIVHSGYIALFILLMLGIVGLPVPDEMLLAFTGFLVFKGRLALEPTLMFAVLGSLCGISLSYALGSFFGSNILVGRVGSFLRLGPLQIEHMHTWYAKWGKYS